MSQLTLRIELFPADMDAFVDFYARVLRFRVTRDHRGDETPYVALERGGVRVGAAQAWADAHVDCRRPPGGVEIVLEVDDLESEARAIQEAGWMLEAPIMRQPWGLRDFRVLDSDGYYLRITTPAGEE